nr:ATPase subunit 8 [Goniurosaurus splendens]
MPQLNPAPWFMTLLVTWLILLMMIKPTMMHTQHPNEPMSNKPCDMSFTWFWPWS